MNHVRKPFAPVVGALLVLAAAAAANADTIYTYTGGDYEGATPPFTDSEHITATFTFATPLAGSLPLANDLPSLLSWTINVGVLSLSLSSTDASDHMVLLELGTGPSGAITAWDFGASGPDPNDEVVSSASGFQDFVISEALIDGFNAGPVFANANPDGWTSTTTPEPSTLVSMALGVAVMLFALRRKARLAAHA
jgi:hypothetical protein